MSWPLPYCSTLIHKQHLKFQIRGLERGSNAEWLCLCGEIWLEIGGLHDWPCFPGPGFSFFQFDMIIWKLDHLSRQSPKSVSLFLFYRTTGHASMRYLPSILQILIISIRFGSLLVYVHISWQNTSGPPLFPFLSSAVTCCPIGTIHIHRPSEATAALCTA